LVRVFDEGIWERLVRRIKEEQCTPFIGAGASAEYIPVAAKLAKDLALEFKYPFDDAHDLARVTQFAAVRTGDRLDIKERLAGTIKNVPAPDFTAPNQPHALLADLGLPIYLTTNYDDFMYKALKSRNLSPQRAVCPWYTTDDWEIEEANRLFEKDSGFKPDKKRPIVYHLHGHHGTPRSLVLTEDDYIDFLVRVSADPKLLPPVIREALGTRMLLFIGFSMADWTFRVIFGGLLSAWPPGARPMHVSVQLPPPTEEPAAEGPAAEGPPTEGPAAEQALRVHEQALRMQEYLDQYFEQQKISICWKNALDFSTELRKRWER
jgi:SIR2-like domain